MAEMNTCCTPLEAGADADLEDDGCAGIERACRLDATQLQTQLDRYRELAGHVARIDRRPGAVLVQFEDDPPTALLERTPETERTCCEFLRIDYDREKRELSIQDELRGQTLEAIAKVLTPLAS